MLRQARTIVCKVLEARQLKLRAGSLGEPVPGPSLVAARLHLELPEDLRGRRVAGLCISGGAEAKVAAALLPASRDRPLEERIRDHSQGGKSGVVIWRPSGAGAGARCPPAEVLLCEGAVTCCTWAPEGLDTLVLAGTEEGAVYLWDLTARLPDGDGDASLDGRRRRPCASTEHGAGFFVHDHSIVSVACVAMTRGGPAGRPSATPEGVESPASLGLGAGGGAASRLLAHVIVLDQRRRVSVWDLREHLGLKELGARFTLTLAQPSVPVGRGAGPSAAGPTRSARSGAEGEDEDIEAPLGAGLATDLAVVRRGAREFLLVGTTSGRVLKGTRQGAHCPSPWEYQHEGGLGDLEGAHEALNAAPIAHVAASPRTEGMFAAAGADGSVGVFSVEGRLPEATCIGGAEEAPRPPVAMMWSRLRPKTLLQIDAGGRMTGWDLTASSATEPGAGAVARPSFSEDLRRAAALSSISHVAVAPRAPSGETDLIAVASAESGEIKCLLIQTPKGADGGF